MSVAADVSDWIVTPAPLNDKKSGERAIFSTDNSIVQRRDPENEFLGCVSYTLGPLPPGQVWQVTVLETTRKWDYGLVSGFVLSLLYHHMIWCVSMYKTTVTGVARGGGGGKRGNCLPFFSRRTRWG